MFVRTNEALSAPRLCTCSMRSPRPSIGEYPGSNAPAGIELKNGYFHTIFAKENCMQKFILMAVAGMALSSHAVASVGGPFRDV